jgi:hypothetical protein
VQVVARHDGLDRDERARAVLQRDASEARVVVVGDEEATARRVERDRDRLDERRPLAVRRVAQDRAGAGREVDADDRGRLLDRDPRDARDRIARDAAAVDKRPRAGVRPKECR